MSLFDGTIGGAKERKSTKAKTVHKGKHRSDDQALLDPRYGTGSRSTERTTAAHRTKDERRAITEAYEKGELKFADVSREFALCHCNQSPDYNEFPHEPHFDEIATFELQTHARRIK